MLANPLYEDRLDFLLPDFTRIIWVSEHAREVWAPRITRIRHAWSEISWLSVVHGLRRCALFRMSEDALLAQAERWFDGGLEAVPLRLENRTGLSYRSTAQPAEPGKPTTILVALGVGSELATIQQAWYDEDHDAMGMLLGYPVCCRHFFQEVWIKQKSVDTTWAMAINSPHSGESRSVEVQGPASSNILWRWAGVRSVFHLPCSFSCQETQLISDQLQRLGQQSGYSQEVDWTNEILNWSIEWSALHGIAEIKTPILKISTRTDATARKYSVRRVGDMYPSEGAVGLRFPFVRPKRTFVSESKSYKRGLSNPISSEIARPEWYHRENGFTSRYSMDRLHTPIVLLAQEALGDSAGNLIDLGCGNGALLAKICESRHGLIPYGVDYQHDALEHATMLCSQSTDHFIQGDLFDVEQWAFVRRYVMALFMIGRLFETTEEKARRLLSALNAQCDMILAYVYPGWSNAGLEELIKRAGLRIVSMNGQIAALVRPGGENDLE